MIVGLCRLLSGLVGWLLLVAFAVAGLVAAVFSIQGGDASLSYAGAAKLASLPDFRDAVDAWLRSLENGGATDTASLLAGLGGVLLGLVLLAGALVPRRDRLVVVEASGAGRLAVRRRAAAGALTRAVEQPRDVVHARAKVRASRRGAGGRARTRIEHAETADRSALQSEAKTAAAAVADDLRLKLRFATKTSGRVR